MRRIWWILANFEDGRGGGSITYKDWRVTSKSWEELWLTASKETETSILQLSYNFKVWNSANNMNEPGSEFFPYIL